MMRSNLRLFRPLGKVALLLGAILVPSSGAAAPLQQVTAPDTTQAGGDSPLSDLAVRFGARGEFGGDWALFRPCDASFQLTCRPGLIPQLQPEIQFDLRAEGSVADRLFVNVNYDQAREFAGSNVFQLYYQGRPGEILQRLELGDVSFALPETRFLTRGIPVGNFGVLMTGEVGGVEVQTVFAQQQGARRSREFRLGGIGSGAGVIYRDTLVLDDADYVEGQFYFLVDPEFIRGSPHVDVLSLRPGDAPSELAPGGAPIQLYRMERDPLLQQQVEGYIQADAVAEGDGQVARESGWFRYLEPGEDYYLHSSGLWLGLRVPLRPGDALAVAYIAENGTTIGDYNPEILHNQGEIPTLRLLRATVPHHQPGRPTWDFEMKQVYRVSGSGEVDPFSLELSISLGETSAGQTFGLMADGRPISFLRLFGLDEQSPAERVDRAAIFRPAEEEVAGAGLQGTFLFFPTLRPFLDPPSVPSEGLSADETQAILADDVNEQIYLAEDPFERDAGGLYRLNLTAEIRSSGVTSVVSLGAFGLREGSERIFLGDRLLRPFVDYVIEYQSGVVTLLQPEALLLRSSSNVLRVSWEEAAVFRIAPTSMIGVSARIPFGESGGLDLIGLYQIERELVNRPRFGAEPSSLALVGARSTTSFALPVLDRALDRLFGDGDRTASELRVDGELAASLPDPNRSGDAFLDDFDAGDERVISLLSQGWQLGSAAERRTGAEEGLPMELDEFSAASLVWQHTWVERDAQGDSIGTFEGFFPAEIDRQINVSGTPTREPGLRITFGSGSGAPFPGPRWRSFTTLLSPSGVDLTYAEYLDFYVAEGDSLTLIVDLGLVSEDAFFLNGEGESGGFHPETGDPWGLGVLDQEADPLRGEIWDPIADRLGVWAESCEADPGRVYSPGDPAANCTAGNGRRDTEDLNGTGVLDTTERQMRYVVRLDGNSPFLIRSRTTTGTAFRLFRVPLRGPNAIDPSGTFTDADWRAIQVLRVTIAGPRASSLTLARMRLVGSRWVKRGVEGVLEGIAGDMASPGGRLEVSAVSAVTDGGAYSAPPGVLERLDDPTTVVSGRGVEFNERSLRLRYEGLPGGDRAEAYFRFLQRPRNFLAYGELRLWAVGRAGDWGPEESTEFFVKVGNDPENFYLYRARLEAISNPAAVRPQDWLPERILRFDEWTALRRVAEERLLDDPPGPGDPPVIVWSADSTYAVVLSDRARAPNLAAVREISLGVWNRGELPAGGEVWVNELRLGAGVLTPAIARILSVELDGGDFFQGRLDYSGQGSHFQQLHESPTYQTDGELALAGTFQLGDFVPDSWGWELPLSVSYRRSDRDPFYLEGTDLRATGLPGLRTSGYRETRLSLSFRPIGETGQGVADVFLSGLDARLSWISSTGTSLTTESRASEISGVVGYSWRPEARTLPLVPEFLEPVARVLIPGALLRHLLETEIRWTPEEVTARSGIRRRTLEVDRFEEIRLGPGGEPAGTGSAPEAWFENRVGAALRPFAGLGMSLEMITIRDLLDPVEGVRDPRVRPAVEDARRTLFGREIGWETRREIVGRLTFRPSLPPWMQADLGIQTRYRHDLDPALVRFDAAADSLPELLRNAGAERDIRASVSLDPEILAESLFPLPETPETGTGLDGVGRALGSVLSPLTFSVQSGITARFQREAVRPGSNFQLGWSGTDSFEELGGVPATALMERNSLSSGSGLRLPGSLFINVNYLTVRAATVDRRSDRQSRLHTWPDLRAGIESLPLPGTLRPLLGRVSLNAGFQRTREALRYGAGVVQGRTRVDRRVPMELSIEWMDGLVTQYRGQVGWGSGTDPTGITERETADHGLSIETRVMPRGGVGNQVEEPLRLSLLLEYTSVVECRIVTGRDSCVDFIDQIGRGVSLAVDTWVSGVEVGGHASLVDRRSFTGLRTGFTQFQVGVWGRMVFESGPIARLGEGLNRF
ncbi:MAG: hypothetical protein WEG36_03160 [Gemmatimonadota bacterium]